MFSHGLCDQFVIHLASINQYSPKKPFWLMLSFLNVEAVLVIAFNLPPSPSPPPTPLIAFTLTPSPPPFPPFAIPSSTLLKPAQAGLVFLSLFPEKEHLPRSKKNL
jgi:hypothetical protein